MSMVFVDLVLGFLFLIGAVSGFRVFASLGSSSQIGS